MTNDCFYIPITEFVIRYPTPQLKKPYAAWAYHFRQWHADGILLFGTHYKSVMGPSRPINVYHERAIMVYIYNHRGGTPFCGLVYHANPESILELIRNVGTMGTIA